MSTGAHPFRIVTFENGSVAVVKQDPRKPQHLEVIANFYDATLARDYADRESRRSDEPDAAKAPTQQRAAAIASTAEISPRQSAVMETLRANMDAHKQVAAKAADLAAAAQIPLGSLHSVLQSLEKKQLIRTVRAGSARAPAVYQVL
jgi:DNA-binding MarR family transcriptional regulator